MAHFDPDENLTVWLGDSRSTASPSVTRRARRAAAPAPGAAVPEGSSCYIVRNWFGPFLFGPVNHSRSGHC